MPRSIFEKKALTNGLITFGLTEESLVTRRQREFANDDVLELSKCRAICTITQGRHHLRSLFTEKDRHILEGIQLP